MRVLVTGGSGNIGRAVLKELGVGHDVLALDTKEPEDSDVQFTKGDITNPQQMLEATKGIETVVHLAAIPTHSHDIPPGKYMDVNVTGAFNVLEAAAQNGVKKVVIASSDSTLGFVFSTHEFSPCYFPIDEEHPLQPQDPYGLSKLLDEELCKRLTRRYGISTVCLRFCWVWQPDTYEHRSLILNEEIELNIKRHFGYVDVRDVAQACRLSVESTNISHDTFFITAADTYADETTLELIRGFYPTVKRVSNDFLEDPYRTLFDISKARKALGYAPKYSWREM